MYIRLSINAICGKKRAHIYSHPTVLGTILTTNHIYVLRTSYFSGEPHVNSIFAGVRATILYGHRMLNMNVYGSTCNYTIIKHNIRENICSKVVKVTLWCSYIYIYMFHGAPMEKNELRANKRGRGGSRGDGVRRKWEVDGCVYVPSEFYRKPYIIF